MSKMLKKQRKNIQKCLKHLSQLFKEECVISDMPTHFILLGNAGHANAIGRADVIEALPPLPCQFKLFFPPNKQFSILYTSELCGDVVSFLSNKRIKTHLVYPAFIENDLDLTDLHQTLSPPGLKIVEDIVTPAMEEELMTFFLKEIEETTNSTNDLKKRATLHYGYRFDYSTNLVNLSEPLDQPIPEILEPVLALLEPCISIVPDQLTVNVYQPGQGIPKHVDTHSVFKREIISLSLGSDVVMDFKQPLTGELRPVLVPARSLTVMSGESRYLWHHGIACRKSDGLDDVTVRGLRVSLTFRECTDESCKCPFPSQCDSQNYGKPLFEPVTAQDAAYLEQQYVTQVYEEIAEHFSHTRHSPWPGVTSFINTLPAHAIVADVGCGNGKYLGARSDVYMLGNDNSTNLIDICRERGHEVFVCNALRVPIRRGTCDGVLCIAMLHHLTTEQRRVAVLQNLVHLLRPGGRGLVTVWAQDQYRDVQDETDCVRPCPTQTSSGEGVGRRHFDSQDVFVDWQKQLVGEGIAESKKYYRYYHVFAEGELEGLFSQVLDVQLEKVTYEKANYFAVFRRQ